MRRDHPHPGSALDPAQATPRAIGSHRTGVGGWILFALILATSLVLGLAGSWWLVPPYLILMGWLVAPGDTPGGGDRNAPVEAHPGRGGPMEREAESSPAHTEAQDPEGGSEGFALGAATDPVSRPDPPVQVRPKRTRGRTRARAVREEASEESARWVRIGPGKYVRVESSEPESSPPIEVVDDGTQIEEIGEDVTDTPRPDDPPPPGPIDAAGGWDLAWPDVTDSVRSVDVNSAETSTGADGSPEAELIEDPGAEPPQSGEPDPADKPVVDTAGLHPDSKPVCDEQVMPFLQQDHHDDPGLAIGPIDPADVTDSAFSVEREGAAGSPQTSSNPEITVDSEPEPHSIWDGEATRIAQISPTLSAPWFESPEAVPLAEDAVELGIDRLVPPSPEPAAIEPELTEPAEAIESAGELPEPDTEPAASLGCMEHPVDEPPLEIDPRELAIREEQVDGRPVAGLERGLVAGVEEDRGSREEPAPSTPSRPPGEPAQGRVIEPIRRGRPHRFARASTLRQMARTRTRPAHRIRSPLGGTPRGRRTYGSARGGCRRGGRGPHHADPRAPPTGTDASSRRMVRHPIAWIRP